MAATQKSSKTLGLPVQSGMLRVSGEIVQGPRQSDSFEFFVDDQGALSLVVLDVQGTAEAFGNAPLSLMRQARTALEKHEPLHQVVNELEMQLAVRPGLEAGVVILRLSQQSARVELLNAGLPAVVNALPDGHLSLHPALSGPLGRRVGEVHPYEVLPLTWGSVWLTISDGMTKGSVSDASVRELCAKLSLSERGMELSAAASDVLYDALQAVLPAARFLRDDATCVLLGADARVAARDRLQSSVEPI